MNIVETRAQVMDPFVHLYTMLTILTQSGLVADAFNIRIRVTEACGSL